MNFEMMGSHANRLSCRPDAAVWWSGTNSRQRNGLHPSDRGEKDRILNQRRWNGRDLVDLLEIDASGPGRRPVKDVTCTMEARTPRLSLLRSVRIDHPMAVRGRSPQGWARWVQPASSAMIAAVESTMGRLVVWWNNRGSFRRRSNSERRSNLAPRSPGRRHAKTRRWPGRSPSPWPNPGR